MCINTWLGGKEGKRQTLLSSIHWQDKGWWAQTETQESPFKRVLFRCKIVWALEQVAQECTIMSASLEIFKTQQNILLGKVL